MIQTYQFLGEPSIEFDDSKTVKELIEYAFNELDYYEPFGIDSVTIFQCHHPQSNYGWFTIDTKKSCVDEIVNRDELCFGYYIPGILYYVEGGWGHHMDGLGNHPVFEKPVSLKLEFDDFSHTVVFEGTHSFREFICLLENTGYIEEHISQIKINVLAYPRSNYSQSIDICNTILDEPMFEFEKSLPQDGIVTLVLE
ncbi:MAG: hypothetical protein MJ166_10450 [Clostridia bacterium]|nr:hypothetical protein [Clostridia bacterium]